MLSDTVILCLSIISWALVISIFSGIRFLLGCLVIIITSVFTVSFPYYLNVGYLDPWTWGGIFLDILFSIPLTFFVFLGTKKLKEFIDTKYKVNTTIVLLILFLIFEFIVLFESFLKLT